MRASGPTVVAEGLRAGYRRWGRLTVVIREATFSASPGSVTLVAGINGSGKTTLFHTLLGILPPWGGRIAVGAGTPAEHRRRHGVGYLPEEVGLPGGWTVGSLLAEGARLRGVARTARSSVVDESVAELGLGEHLHKRVTHLSRGARRRVAFCFATLAARDRLLLLDEPMANLDVSGRSLVSAAVRRLRSLGNTCLLATHELAGLLTIADRALVLRRGELVTIEGAPSVREAERLQLAVDASGAGSDTPDNPGPRGAR